MAEGFFASHLKKIDPSFSISSAGLTAVVNHPAEPSAQKIMREHGIDISSHIARQLNPELMKNHDLILVMTKSQLESVSQYHTAYRSKTFLLGHWQQLEIQDPYKLSDEAFKIVYQQITLAWQYWKTRILPC